MADSSANLLSSEVIDELGDISVRPRSRSAESRGVPLGQEKRFHLRRRHSGVHDAGKQRAGAGLHRTRSGADGQDRGAALPERQHDQRRLSRRWCRTGAGLRLYRGVRRAIDETRPAGNQARHPSGLWRHRTLDPAMRPAGRDGPDADRPHRVVVHGEKNRFNR